MCLSQSTRSFLPGQGEAVVPLELTPGGRVSSSAGAGAALRGLTSRGSAEQPGSPFPL